MYKEPGHRIAYGRWPQRALKRATYARVCRQHYFWRNAPTAALTLASSQLGPKCPQSESSSKMGACNSAANPRAGSGVTTWSYVATITKTWALTDAAAPLHRSAEVVRHINAHHRFHLPDLVIRVGRDPVLGLRQRLEHLLSRMRPVVLRGRVQQHLGIFKFQQPRRILRVLAMIPRRIGFDSIDLRPPMQQIVRRQPGDPTIGTALSINSG